MTTPVLSTRLRAVSGAANDVKWSDQNGVVTVSHGSATTLTLPESTDVDFPLGSQIFVIQVGAGAVTVAKTGSDTIAGTVATAAAGDTLIVTKTSSTGWHSALAT